MNQESTDQVQGQKSASTIDTTTLQNQSDDTSNIQLRSSEADETKPQQSTTTKTSCEAHKSLIRNLYNLLVCENLPATDESSDFSNQTNKIFSASEISKNETFDKKIDEFIDILEVLSEPCGCDKIKSHDCANNMKKNVQSRIEKIKIEKSRLTLLIKEDKLQNIAQKYENLKENEALVKILFHKCYQARVMCQTKCGEENEATVCEMSGNESGCKEENQSFLSENKILKELKNYQSGNQKFVLKDLCDTFERIVIPKIQKILSLIESVNHLTWDTLDDSIKSTILKSFIDYQGFYIPLQELIQNHPEHLQNISCQQIMDIIQNGFTKVSKIEYLTVPVYLKRTIFGNRETGQIHTDRTKNYNNFKKELKSNKILILTDDLGTGKTTTLKYLARRFKEDDKKLWTSYIDAKMISNIFLRIRKIQNWNVDVIVEFLTKILALTGIEVPIFKQKFKDNDVILFWDNIDEKFQPTFIDFVWNIKKLTENQQAFATRIRYSDKLAQIFECTAYRFIPFTTPEIQKFHRKTEEFMNYKVDADKFLNFCDSVELGEREYINGRKIFINNNILMYKLILLAFVDIKMDFDYRIDQFLLFERVFKKQLMDCTPKLTEIEERKLMKFLQAHALNSIFGDELTKSLEIVKKYANIQPSISSLDGIFAVNFDDNSVDFQHKIIEEYFVMKFIMDNILDAELKEVTGKEAKTFVLILATICTQHQRLLNLINHALQSKYKKTHDINKVHESIAKIIRKAQYWPKVTKLVCVKELRFIEEVDGNLIILDNLFFWRHFFLEIQNEKDTYEEKYKGSQAIQQQKVKKNSKVVIDRPGIKGVTSMKKLDQNHEISHQLNEFLEDMGSDEIDED